MSLKLPCPMRRKRSSLLQFRQRIPRDVLEKARGQVVAVPVGDGWVRKTIPTTASEITITLATRDPVEAKQRQARAYDHLQSVWNAMRQGPASLTRKQVVALAGVAYRELAEGLEEEPGEPEVWDLLIRINERAESAGHDGTASNPLQIVRKERTKEEWFGPLVDQVLAREGLVVDEESRERLIDETAKAVTEAAQKLRRNAMGDYSPDEKAARFPPLEKPAKKRAPTAPRNMGKASLSALLEDWWKEGQATGLSAKTYQSYSSAIAKLARFLRKPQWDASRSHELAPDIANAITGHARRTVADRYGEDPMAALARELEKIPALRGL